ncbi:hypothetical protein [Anthocerotibacter panamensis]|uniref:hypothetical protein n=1 Tax=Anthocerotibacter panamensis TaxID=2857077 RepID=UPI001C406875|nr:hypothetical protein [Anthocerotibacter panamensis]
MPHLSLAALYTVLGRFARQTYVPLLVLQGLALLAVLAANSTPDGPPRGIAQALVPLGSDPLITGTSLAFVYPVLVGRPVSLGSALVQALAAWPRLVATSLLTVLAALMPSGWLFYFAYRRFEQAVSGAEGWGMVALPFGGMILCALPGLYIGFRLFVTVPLIFIEPLTPVAALRRSWQLMGGRLGTAFLAYVPLGVLVLVLGFLLNLLLSGTELAQILAPGNPPLAGVVLALRLVGPLGWTLYVVYSLNLLGIPLSYPKS